MICYRCLHVGDPLRQWSKSASIWYLGCAACGCGVFYR